jgi:hypothetical protein
MRLSILRLLLAGFASDFWLILLGFSGHLGGFGFMRAQLSR